MTAAPSRWTMPTLLAVIVLSIIGFGVVTPLMPAYGSIFHAPAWQVTAMFAGFSLGQFCGELVWGRLSDRFGRQPVLIATTFFSALGYVAFAFSGDIWMAIGARVWSGVFGGNLAVVQSYIADISPREKLAGRLGLTSMAYGAGVVLGPAMGGLLAQPDFGLVGFRPPLLVSAALCGVAALGVLFFVPEARRASPGTTGRTVAWKEALASPVLPRLYAMTFAAFFTYSAWNATLGLWGDARMGWSPRELGLIISVVGVALMLGQGLLAGPAVRLLGEAWTIIAGFGLAAAALVVQALSTSSLLAIACVGLATLGVFLSQPAIVSLISNAVEPDAKGAMLGLNAATGASARIVGPLLAGPLFGLWLNAPLYLGALAMAAGSFLALSTRRSGHAS